MSVLLLWIPQPDVNTFNNKDELEMWYCECFPDLVWVSVLLGEVEAYVRPQNSLQSSQQDYPQRKIIPVMMSDAYGPGIKLDSYGGPCVDWSIRTWVLLCLYNKVACLKVSCFFVSDLGGVKQMLSNKRFRVGRGSARNNSHSSVTFSPTGSFFPV